MQYVLSLFMAPHLLSTELFEVLQLQRCHIANQLWETISLRHTHQLHRCHWQQVLFFDRAIQLQSLLCKIDKWRKNYLLSKNSNLLVPIWASVTELLFFTITHQDFFLWRLLHGGLGCSNIRKLHLMINLLLLHYQSFFTFWGMSCKFFRIGLGLWRLF